MERFSPIPILAHRCGPDFPLHQPRARRVTGRSELFAIRYADDSAVSFEQKEAARGHSSSQPKNADGLVVEIVSISGSPQADVVESVAAEATVKPQRSTEAKTLAVNYSMKST